MAYNFKDLYLAVERHVRIRGEEYRDLIKNVINESILEFAREREWQKLLFERKFTTDGSGSYDLDVLLNPAPAATYGITVPAANDVGNSGPDTLLVAGNLDNSAFAGVYEVEVTGVATIVVRKNTLLFATISLAPAENTPYPLFTGATFTFVNSSAPFLPAVPQIGDLWTFTIGALPISSLYANSTLPPFLGERKLYVPEGDYTKLDHYNYQRLNSKAYHWAVFDNKIWVEGDGVELTLVYASPGLPHPYVNDTDQGVITRDYFDLIKQWSVHKFLVQVGDLESAKVEEAERNRKVVEALRAENRHRNNGKRSVVAVYNR